MKTDKTRSYHLFTIWFQTVDNLIQTWYQLAYDVKKLQSYQPILDLIKDCKDEAMFRQLIDRNGIRGLAHDLMRVDTEAPIREFINQYNWHGEVRGSDLYRAWTEWSGSYAMSATAFGIVAKKYLRSRHTAKGQMYQITQPNTTSVRDNLSRRG